MTRASILSAAAACVTQDRNNTYGPPEDSFAVIASYWSVYLGVPVTPAGVGTLLALMKIARLQHNPAHADSYVDGAGYLACAGEIATEHARGKRIMGGLLASLLAEKEASDTLVDEVCTAAENYAKQEAKPVSCIPADFDAWLRDSTAVIGADPDDLPGWVIFPAVMSATHGVLAHSASPHWGAWHHNVPLARLFTSRAEAETCARAITLRERVSADETPLNQP